MPPPDRWEEYQPLGTVIPGTKFIAFKVPLKQEICKNLAENLSFTPSDLIQRLTDKGISLGLVVDLTFTQKYYNKREFTRHSIQHEKIWTKGHDVPSEDVYTRFGEVVDTFSEENAGKDILIGVHCTHGVNRTGYLVCRYMIEKLKIAPDEAITLFNTARGHPLERENYIADLKTRPQLCDPEPPISLAKDMQDGLKDQDQKSKKRQLVRSVRDRSPHMSKNRPQRFDHTAGRQQNSQNRRGYHDDRSHLRNGRSFQRHHSEQSYHVSPLSRLEGPPEPSWGSGSGGGWGSSAGSRGHRSGQAGYHDQSAGRQRGSREFHSFSRSRSHPYARDNERWTHDDDFSRRSRSAQRGSGQNPYSLINNRGGEGKFARKERGSGHSANQHQVSYYS